MIVLFCFLHFSSLLARSQRLLLSEASRYFFMPFYGIYSPSFCVFPFIAPDLWLYRVACCCLYCVHYAIQLFYLFNSSLGTFVKRWDINPKINKGESRGNHAASKEAGVWKSALRNKNSKLPCNYCCPFIIMCSLGMPVFGSSLRSVKHYCKTSGASASGRVLGKNSK